jgi:hypothetical protein
MDGVCSHDSSSYTDRGMYCVYVCKVIQEFLIKVVQLFTVVGTIKIVNQGSHIVKNEGRARSLCKERGRRPYQDWKT